MIKGAFNLINDVFNVFITYYICAIECINFFSHFMALLLLLIVVSMLSYSYTIIVIPTKK